MAPLIQSAGEPRIVCRSPSMILLAIIIALLIMLVGTDPDADLQ